MNILKRFVSWLKSWFQRSDDFKWDIFHPVERKIYSYWNGREIIKADPMVLHKRVMDVGPELANDMKVVEAAENFPTYKGASECYVSMLKKIRNIFKVEDPKEDGTDCTTTLSQLELVALLNHFLIYTERIKKNSSKYQTLPEGTSPSIPALEEPKPPTPNGLDSGSTGKEPPTVPPTPSS